MKMYELIFSDKKVERIKRHVLFWSAFYLYQVVRMSFLFPHAWIKLPSILFGSLIWGVLLNLLFSYSIVYYLVPKFFVKKKYLVFVAGILVLFVVIFSLAVLNGFLNGQLRQAVGFTKQQPWLHMRGTLVRMFGNPPLICAVLLSFRNIKNWHKRQLENETLTRETINAELQLLKAQIHPHFLFNTLNNIYSFTLTKSPVAAELVQKLSDMLNYMIEDCNNVMVPVEKEIQLIKDYIGLEKVRYGERLDIQMHVNGDCNNCMIAPLLMIPFVENCFKHGASMMRGRQWMHLIININESDLELTLSNSKPARPNSSNKEGIGLLNVQKRLALLYPEKHQLNLNSTDNTFSIYLKIELQKALVTNVENKFINTPVETFLQPNIHH